MLAFLSFYLEVSCLMCSWYFSSLFLAFSSVTSSCFWFSPMEARSSSMDLTWNGMIRFGETGNQNTREKFSKILLKDKDKRKRKPIYIDTTRHHQTCIRHHQTPPDMHQTMSDRLAVVLWWFIRLQRWFRFLARANGRTDGRTKVFQEVLADLKRKRIFCAFSWLGHHFKERAFFTL